jgi:hypothetical protein
VNSAAFAAAFLDAIYDASADELLVTLTYRGTNPDHNLHLEWGECQERPPGGAHEIAARVLDDQWNDRAREEFTKPVRFSLADLRCRPAVVTLLTEPHFSITVHVPARGASLRDLRGPHIGRH